MPTTELPPNLLTLVEALESGEWEQTDSQLAKILDQPDNSGNPERVGYCCLGVGTECYLKELGEESQVVRVPSTTGGAADCVGYGYEWGGPAADDIYAPEPAWMWLGLRDSHGTFNATGLAADPVMVDAQRYLGDYSLAGLNDVGFTFAEIAAFIRRNPQALLA